MTIKTILASLRGDDMDPRVLAVAGGFAQRFHSHLAALFVEPDPTDVLASVMFDVGGGAYFTDQLIGSLQKENDVRRNAAKASYSAWRVAAAVPETTAPGEAANESAQLMLKVGDDQIVRDHALASDIVVTALAERSQDEGNVGLEVALIDAGRPVIALPRHCAPAAEDAPVAVAWKPGAEAAHAVAAALPFLRDASRVTVLHAGSVDNASSLNGILSYLAWHGIRAEGEEMGSTKEPELLLSERVSELAPSLLVMGAYTHSRAREFVFGGVTRHMLRETRVPLLIAH